MTGTTKLASTAGLFLVALAILVVAAATHSAIPLFFMWAPLLGVPWVLVRPAPGGTTSAHEHQPARSEAEPEAEPGEVPGEEP